MFELFKKFLGKRPKTDFSKLLKEGAVIVDVRSKGEFEGGHIPGAINIPVDQLKNNLNKLRDKNQPIITCCASGMRSASAKSILSSCGYLNIYNGGGWWGLQKQL